ncbi:hypothetical protein E8E12_006628 [Didymella heteroderae]|uniref:DRBM domain-containing protein n=1 Tax=Didymella heteroderae TaxID=1769908 RepID=A0A9P4WPC0_9PLEO|nr:hypothetical protein E8E12_006628 [Didymella heteroderae]
MVIEKEHQGRACINPKDMLAAMEASYWTDPNRNDDDGNTRYPRVETFNRINAARLTKSEEAFKTFMDQLSSDIKRHCRRLREGAVAELAAQPQDTLGITYRTESPKSTTSTGSSLEKGSVTSDSDEDTSSSSQDEAKHARTIPQPQSLPVSESLEAELPMHKYTSMLWEFAARSGKEPSFIEGGIPGAWICEASFDGCCRQATAQNKKKARHVAAKMLCQALQIPQGLTKV